MTATVVAVTSDPDKAACMEFGFDHVLPKPLTAHSCYKVLRRWLESRAHRMFTAPSAADHPDGDGDDGSFGSEGFGGGFGGGSGLYPGGSSGMGGSSDMGGSSGMGGMGAMGSLGCMGSNGSMGSMGGRACGDGHGTSPLPPRSGSDGATTCTCGGGGGSSGSTSGGIGGGHAAGGDSGARSVSDARCDVGQPSNRAGDAGSMPEWPTHG